jgi:hypothetical protein
MTSIASGFIVTMYVHKLCSEKSTSALFTVEQNAVLIMLCLRLLHRDIRLQYPMAAFKYNQIALDFFYTVRFRDRLKM